MSVFENFVEMTGYKPVTSLWDMFTIAEKLGEKSLEDFFGKAFEKCKTNYLAMTELVIVTNHKIWEYYKTDEPLARLYNSLWEKCDLWAIENLKGDELEYFVSTTD